MASTKDEIARHLQERAADKWGAERAKALKSQIEETAEALRLVAQARFELDAEEPDFLVARVPHEEA